MGLGGHAVGMTGKREAWGKAGRVSAFGLTAGTSMLVFGAAGVWIDRRLDTAPIFTVLLFLSGGASAFWYGIVRFLK